MPLPKKHEVKKVVDPELTLRFSAYIKNAFCLALREAFSHPATPEEYRYYQLNSPANEIISPATLGPRDAVRKRQIAIYRAWPKRDLHLPCIIVETAMGDASITTLGSEDGRERLDPSTGVVLGVEYFGTMYMPVKMTIYAETPTDRERLTDLVTIFVRFVFRDKFYREQIPYLGIQAGEDGEEERNGVPLFLGSVSVMAQTEFDQFIDQTMIAAVESIDIQGTQFGSDADDMQSNYEV